MVRDSLPAPLVHGWIFSLSDGLLNVLSSGYEAGAAQPAETAPAAAHARRREPQPA